MSSQQCTNRVGATDKFRQLLARPIHEPAQRARVGGLGVPIEDGIRHVEVRALRGEGGRGEGGVEKGDFAKDGEVGAVARWWSERRGGSGMLGTDVTKSRSGMLMANASRGARVLARVRGGGDGGRVAGAGTQGPTVIENSGTRL